MYSYRSEYSDRRPHSDRNARRWNDYDDRPSYHRHDGDRHGRTEKMSRSKEYSDSPHRTYNKDPLNRDWAKKSPVRRRMSSPDRSSSESKRRRFAEDYEDDYRHRRDPEDKTNRQSPEDFSRLNVSKDFKRILPQEERHGFRCTKTHKESRYRPIREEFTYRKQYDDYRPLSPHHKERDHHKRSWDCSQERTQLPDRSNKSHSKPRERDGDHCADYKDQCQNGQRFLSNGSGEQSFNRDVTNQTPIVPGQKSTKGFQRFLDVLNKGVNVAMLTKIVTQTSQEVDRPCSPVPFANAAGLSSPVSTVNQQGSNQINCHWSEHEGSQRLACPLLDHRSFSPRVCSVSEQQCDGGRGYQSSKHRSKSPSVVENITLTPEDEHRQMQDVLQAIGMDLGFEELGQMSHRIKERLYGKKDDDWGPHHRGSKERDTRRTSSPSRQSRSSSSRSNVSPLTQDYMVNKVCYSAQRDVTELVHIQVHHAGEFGQNRSSGSLEHNNKCETKSQECSAVLQSPAYTISEAPVMPTYSPVNSSVLPYPPMAPVLPPVLPPHLPHGVPRLLLPHLPPILPYPHIPPLNILPAVLTPNRHLLPQHINNPRSSIFSQSDVNSVQPLNALQKSKTLSRPRCLQVIETKQPG